MKQLNKQQVFIALGAVTFFVLAISCFIGYKTFTGKKYITYQETSSIDYTVCFKQPNDFYDKECLPKTINNYVTKYIDYINVNFDYKLDLNNPVNTTYKYMITAELTIYDRNNNSYIMNQKNYTLIPEKELDLKEIKELKLSELVKINYEEYDNFVSNYKNNASVQAGANLRVILHIESANQYSEASKPIVISNDLSVNIPLGETTIQLNSEYKPTNDSPQIEIDTNKTAVNNVFKYFSLISGFIGTVFLIILVFSANKKYNEKPVYTRLINELLKDYDADITTLKNLIDTEDQTIYTYLDVDSFKELYEQIKKSGDKQIFWNEKKDYDDRGNLKNRISWFFVFMSEEKVIRFVVDEKILIRKYRENSNVISEYRG